MGTIPHEIRRLLDDCELFVTEILEDEDLSESAAETRKVLLNNFLVVHARLPQEFPARFDSRDDEGSDDNRSSSLGRSAPSDDASVSDYQDDGVPEYLGDIPPIGAQELTNNLKQGFLEKKRKDHSFFGSEWQKRWCVLNHSVFYYFGSEKDKQQKGSFYISDYSVQLSSSLRKDSKKNACFEFTAPGRRAFQFTASSPQDAREWVDQINFVLKDLSSNIIPVDDDEYEDEYDDIEGLAQGSPLMANPGPSVAQGSQVIKQIRRQEKYEPDDEDDIYEELPEEDLQEQVEETAEKNNQSAMSSEYANYYQGLWDCQADETDELDFKRGDLIYVISKEYNIHGWWVGELNGTVGIVPKDFLQPAYIL
ncbi:src kinase-associated phosphoprotein 1 isoform X2 [Poeciliopsis prolifica]|uniref:src kinase-associated phosphoprotein 1 isoform X2 n=1 Tax=Poeciliopsis prolifica TaxID=188132 RepID=UPI002413520F|nr:src kinase-associated phosphoprotein 1 isoform X2 [Poeciliopsis prolifica]